MITLPFHTSYALQPLDVTCFKPFKTKLKKKRVGIMANRNYTKFNKFILLHGAQGPRPINHKININFGFKACGL
jgi:hypothetical protein